MDFFDFQSLTESLTKLFPAYEVEISNLATKYSQFLECVANAKKCTSNGAIIFGKSGTGKSLLAKTFAETLRVPFTTINPSSIFRSDEGETEQLLYSKVASVITDAQSQKTQNPNRCAILIIDDLDLLFSASSSAIEQRCAQFVVDVIDNLVSFSGDKVRFFTLGVTNRMHVLSANILRAGRLDLHIELRVRSSPQRIFLLKYFLSSIKADRSLITDAALENIERSTIGLTGAGLQHLCCRAAVLAVKESQGVEVQITPENFVSALRELPNNMFSEYTAKLPDQNLNDLKGIEDIVESLNMILLKSVRQSKVYQDFHLQPPRGLLFYGPPGTGKSTLALSLASELKLPTLSVDASQIRSKYVGYAEKTLSTIFSEAKNSAPCILLIDQIEILLGQRGSSGSTENSADRIVACFLTELDGVFSINKPGEFPDIIIIATTSRPDLLDPAVLRPGRIDKHFHIPIPNASARVEIFVEKLKNTPHTLLLSEINQLSLLTHGYSGSDIENICREAATNSIRNAIRHGLKTPTPVTLQDMLSSLQACPSSILNWTPTHPCGANGTVLV